MPQTRLNGLAMISIENERVKKLNVSFGSRSSSQLKTEICCVCNSSNTGLIYKYYLWYIYYRVINILLHIYYVKIQILLLYKFLFKLQLF